MDNTWTMLSVISSLHSMNNIAAELTLFYPILLNFAFYLMQVHQYYMCHLLCLYVFCFYAVQKCYMKNMRITDIYLEQGITDIYLEQDMLLDLDQDMLVFVRICQCQDMTIDRYALMLDLHQDMIVLGFTLVFNVRIRPVILDQDILSYTHS